MIENMDSDLPCKGPCWLPQFADCTMFRALGTPSSVGWVMEPFLAWVGADRLVILMQLCSISWEPGIAGVFIVHVAFAL